LNDPSEIVRLQAIRELELKASKNYVRAVELLSSFVRQPPVAAPDGEPAPPDVQAAFTALGTLQPPKGEARAPVSLRKAILRGYRGTGAGLDLRGFDFANADLSGADLRNCDFSEADLSGALLHDTELEGAKLEEAEGYVP
jgi:hypothetical protein